MPSPSPYKSIRTTILLFLALGGIWVLMILLANPAGDFPLNDDWAYAESVYHLVNYGNLRIGWISTTLIAQIFWGALFCLPFGFSFTALRVSTLTMGLIGIFAVYGLLREVKAGQGIAFLGALVTATNIIYFGMANTFMTDVPFFAVAMLSFLLLIRGIRSGNKTELLTGLLLAGAATLIRHIGVVIAVSFGMAYLTKNGLKKKTLLIAVLPTVSLIVILLAYDKWLRLTHGLTFLFSIFNQRFLLYLKAPLHYVIINFVGNTGGALVYLGLFLLPFLIIIIPRQLKSLFFRRRYWTFISAGFLVILTAGLLWTKILMPFYGNTGNILIDIGQGPTTLRDEFILRLSHIPRAPQILWILVTVVGLAAAMALFWNLFSALMRLVKKRETGETIADQWLLVFLLSAGVIYFLPMGVSSFFDRYLIFLMPLLMMLLVLSAGNLVPLNENRWAVFIAVSLLVVYGIFALAATHDYFSWNRARWRALNHLTAGARISYKNIDGGYEFNGWYGWYYGYREIPGKSWWWIYQDDYIVSFGPIRGYEEIMRFPYIRWIPYGQGNILVLQKQSNTIPQAPPLSH